MYFELQLSASVFTRVVRNRLRSLPLGVDLTIPDPEGGGQLVVDQVIIGDSTTLQREQSIDYINNVPFAKDAATHQVTTFSPLNLAHFTVPYLQVKQEVRVLLVRASDLEKNGPAPTSPFRTLTIFPVFNIALNAANQTQGGGPLTLSYTLAYVDFGVVGLTMDDAQRAQIGQVIGGVKIDSSIVDLSSMSKLLNRNVSAINAGIACDPSGTRVALRADFDVYASPIAVERAFFEAGPADLLAGKGWAMLVDASVLTQEAEKRIKDALKAKSNLRVRSDPAGSWDAGETTLRISSDITLVGACPGIGEDINMDVRLDLGARYSVPTPDHLVSHYQLDAAKTNNDQVFGCALTGVLLYPFAGAALLEDKKIDLKGYLGGIAFGPYFTFGQLVGLIHAQKLEDDISDSLGDTCHKLNDSEYECTSVVNLVIQLVPSLNSRFVLDWAHGVPEGLVLSGPVANLGEIFIGSIGDISQKPFAWQIIGACTGNGKNNFRIGNQAKIFVPYTPPAAVIKARILSDPEHGYAMTVNDNEITIVPSNPPVSYACQVRLITNRGVRTLTIPAAQKLKDGEGQELQTKLLGKSLTCFYWEKQFTNLEKMLWRVDPAFHVIRDSAVRQWQILVKALDPSSKLNVRTPDGSTILSGRPSPSGTLRLSLMFADQGAPDELTLELERSHNADAKPLEVSVRQTLYSLQASLPVQGEVRRIEVTGALGRPHLAVTTDRQALRWDVGNPLAPQLLQATNRHSVNKQEEREERASHNGCQLDGHSTPNFLRALMNFFKGRGHHHKVGSPHVRGLAETLDLPTTQGATGYKISAPDQPLEIHTLSIPGWHEDTAVSLNLMARHDPARHVIDLYEVAGRHTV